MGVEKARLQHQNVIFFATPRLCVENLTRKNQKTGKLFMDEP